MYTKLYNICRHKAIVQDLSGENLAEQLATGATSAANAATQLEDVVNQLRHVVGK